MKPKVGDIIEFKAGSSGRVEYGVIVAHETVYTFPYAVRFFSGGYGRGFMEEEIRVISKLTDLEIQLL